MKTVDGRDVRIIDPGLMNDDAGPDFFNATVQIGNETWVGNIEIHIKASDWYRHRHQHDRAYDSVILHVVQTDDMPVTRPDGSTIPQITIQCTAKAIETCRQLIANSAHSLPCHNTIRNIAGIYITDWLTALAYERLYAKSDRLTALTNAHRGDWAQAAFTTLARALGFGLNSQPFEQLAASTPLACMRKHADDQDACEAIIFGQAGLIPAPSHDEHAYTSALRENYMFLANKFGLKCTQPAFKMGRTRPQNLPYKRLAYLAQFACYSDCFIEELETARTLDDMRRVFDHPLIGFWATHYTFSPTSADRASKAFGAASLDKLLVNVAIPLLHARATARGDLDRATLVAQLYETIGPEENRLTVPFSRAGIKNDSAFTSQALIHLRQEYCSRNKCIYCRFGHRMLSAQFRNDQP